MESKNVSLPIDEIAMLFGQLMVDNQSKGSDEVKNSENIETGVGVKRSVITIELYKRFRAENFQKGQLQRLVQ